MVLVVVRGTPTGEAAREVKDSSHRISSNSDAASNRTSIDNAVVIGDSTDEWKRFFVSVNELHLQPAWLQDIHIVGPLPDTGLSEIAVEEAFIQRLFSNGTAIELVSIRDPERCAWMPSRQEIELYKDDAPLRAKSRFISLATHGIRSGCDLRRYYREYLSNDELSLPIEWTVLAHDIAVSSDRVQRNFSRICTFLYSLCVDKPPGATTDGWIDHFCDLAQQLGCLPCPQSRSWLDWQRIKLVRRLLESAGARNDPGQNKCNVDLSANRNFAILGPLLDVDGLCKSYLSPFGYVRKPNKSVPQVIMLGDGGCGVHDLVERILEYVPIGYSYELYDAIPASFCNNVRYATVKGAQRLMACTWKRYPRLKKSENGLLVLLCYYAREYPVKVDPWLVGWAHSDDADKMIRQTLTRMLRCETKEESILILSALFFMSRLRRGRELRGVVHDSTMKSFHRLLIGRQLENWRAIVERVAALLVRAVADSFAVRHFVDIQLPCGVDNQFDHYYWMSRIHDNRGHGYAWREARQKCRKPGEI